MNLEDVKRDFSPERRNVRVNIRIKRSQDKFIQENNLSFTKIFDQALKQLGYKEPTYNELEKERDSLKDSYRESKVNKNNYLRSFKRVKRINRKK